MTLAILRGYVQTHLATGDDLSREVNAAIEHGLLRPHDGQALQATISLVRHLAGQALEHGTEVEVPRADGQTTHVLGDRPR